MTIERMYKYSHIKKIPNIPYIYSVDEYNNKLSSIFDTYDKLGYRNDLELHRFSELIEKIDGISIPNVYNKKLYYIKLKKSITKILFDYINENSKKIESGLLSDNFFCDYKIISQYIKNEIYLINNLNIKEENIDPLSLSNFLDKNNMEIEKYYNFGLSEDKKTYIKSEFLKLYGINYNDLNQESPFLKELNSYFDYLLNNKKNSIFFLLKKDKETLMSLYLNESINDTYFVGGFNGTGEFKGKGLYFNIFKALIENYSGKKIIGKVGYEINGKLNTQIVKLFKKYRLLGFYLRPEIGVSEGSKYVYIIK